MRRIVDRRTSNTHTRARWRRAVLQGMFLARGQDAVVADIERRIAEWTLMPVGNGEGLQVLVGAWDLGGSC